MKNTIKPLVVALTSLAFTGVSFAQTKPAIPVTPARGDREENGDEIREGSGHCSHGSGHVGGREGGQAYGQDKGQSD